MRIGAHHIFFIAILISVSGCKQKTWEVVDISKEIKGADPTASIFQIEAYIYNIYIGLTGRKPSEVEFQEARKLLIGSQADRISRVAFVRSIFEKEEFYYNLYDLMRKDVMEDTDTVTIREEYEEAVQRLSDPGYQSQWARYEELKKEYEMLMQSVSDLRSDQMGLTGLYRRGVDNDIYDEINMGSENFVVSNFTFFIGRYPTEQELAEGKKMVDSRSAMLFLQSGNNKYDFLNIFFESLDYKEGLIRRLFERYLYREPSAYERDIYIERLGEDKEYKELIVALFSSDEYYRQQ
jgi:hypothetical protein